MGVVLMNEEKCIYILLTDTGTLFTKIIKFFTRKPLNHASIAFDQELKEIYSFGRKQASNPFIGGFVKEDKHSALLRQSMCAVYSYKVSVEIYDKMHRRVRYFEAKKAKYRYNFIGLLGVLFNRGVKRRHAFFCSQFVAMVLADSGAVIVNKDPALVQPYDFVESGQLAFVYSGELSRFHACSS